MITNEEIKNLGYTKLNEIPNYFIGKQMKASHVVKDSLKIAKVLDLIPKDSNLRFLWYAFIKKSLQNGSNIKNLDKAFYGNTKNNMVENNELYELYNIITSTVFLHKNYPKGFGNSVLCLEKKTDFPVFKNLSRLLGISTYTFGGQPSFSGTEFVFKSLPEKQDLTLFTFVDFDPSGLDISNAFLDQFTYFTNHFEYNPPTLNHIGVNPLYYTRSELERSLYEVKGSNKSRWNSEEMKLLRGVHLIEDNQGLEVQSLNNSAENIFNVLFDGFNLNAEKGQSLMRLIVLSKLIDQFGIDEYWNYNLDESFDNYSDSLDIISKNSGLDELKELIYSIEKDLENVIGKFKEDLEEDRELLESDLNDWKNDTITDFMNSEDNKHQFTQKLIDSVTNDRTYVSIKKFEIPENYLNREITQDKINNITQMKEKLQSLKDELTEMLDE